MADQSLRELLRESRDQFESAAIPAVDAELLLAHVLGISRMELHSRQFLLTDDQREEFVRLKDSRLSGIATQYLVGKAPFRYREFDVGPGVLIPRPETELLVDLALAEIERRKAPTSIVDLGAGSGAIAISIAQEARQRGFNVSVIAVENDPHALVWLRRNISLHDADIRVIESDVAEALHGVRVDLVIANPPYIPIGAELPSLVVDNEPASALFGGSEDGLQIPFRFIAAASRILKPEGFLILEHHESQRVSLEAHLSNGYRDIMSYRDLNQRDRAMSARKLS